MSGRRIRHDYRANRARQQPTELRRHLLFKFSRRSGEEHRIYGLRDATAPAREPAPAEPAVAKAMEETNTCQEPAPKKERAPFIDVKGWKKGLHEKPVRFLASKTLTSKLAWGAAALYGAATSAHTLYENPEKRTLYLFLKTAFGEIKDACKVVLYNIETSCYALGGILMVSALLRPSSKHKSRRISFAAAVAGAPHVANDILANIGEEAKELEQVLDLGKHSTAFAGVAIGTLVLSFFLSADPPAKKEKAEKPQGKVSSFLSNASTEFWWGVYNGLGAMLNAAAKPFLILGEWIYSIREKMK